MNNDKYIDLESCNISYHSVKGDGSSLASTRSPFLRMASYLSFSEISKKNESGSGLICDGVETFHNDLSCDDTSHGDTRDYRQSFSRRSSFSKISFSRASSFSQKSCDGTSHCEDIDRPLPLSRRSSTSKLSLSRASSFSRKSCDGTSHCEDIDCPLSLSRKSSTSKLSLSRGSSHHSRKRLLMIPPPGVGLSNDEVSVENDTSKKKGLKLDLRVVPAECSICLAEYEVGDHISWSAFGHCKHVFHRDCLMQWFLAHAKNEDLARQNEDGDDIRHMMDFDSPCPNCRQDFL